MPGRVPGLPRLPPRQVFFVIFDAGTTPHHSTSPTHPHRAMNVLALTIFVGFVLVTLFVLLWFLQAISPEAFSEREALLPFDGENADEPKRPTTQK